jgi:predicted RNA-binding protein with PUA-like domain
MAPARKSSTPKALPKATAPKPTAKAAPKATAPKPTAPKATAKAAPGSTPATTVTPRRKPPQSMPYEQGAWAHVFRREPGERRYWLIKSEPDVFAFDDLTRAPRKTTCWDSVRNATARNFMRDGMRRGDRCFYYHSNADPSAIVGICEVVTEGYPDHTALDPAHDYFDPKSDAETPTWFMVDVKAVEALPRAVSLAELKAEPALANMALVKVGRLSVVPVTADEWETVLAMSRRPPR